VNTYLYSFGSTPASAKSCSCKQAACHQTLPKAEPQNLHGRREHTLLTEAYRMLQEAKKSRGQINQPVEEAILRRRVFLLHTQVHLAAAPCGEEMAAHEARGVGRT